MNKHIDLLKLKKHIDELRKAFRFGCVNQLLTSNEIITIKIVIDKYENILINISTDEKSS